MEGTTGRSIPEEIFTVLDECGKSVPYAWVEVIYSGTTDKAPIGWKRNMKPMYLYPQNPIQADHNGRVRLFFKGGPVDIIMYNNCNGAPGDVVSRIVDIGGFQEGDFPLDQRKIVECIDLENPVVSVYDSDNCNQPAFLATPLALHIDTMIKAGLPSGKYSDVKKYFECLGEPWIADVVVYSDCNKCPRTFRYLDSCDEECPPDPCSVKFNASGLTKCWKDCTHECDSLLEDDVFETIYQNSIIGTDPDFDQEFEFDISDFVDVPVCATHARLFLKARVDMENPLNLNQTEEAVIWINNGSGFVKLVDVNAAANNSLDETMRDSDTLIFPAKLFSGKNVKVRVQLAAGGQGTGTDATVTVGLIGFESNGGL